MNYVTPYWMEKMWGPYVGPLDPWYKEEQIYPIGRPATPEEMQELKERLEEPGGSTPSQYGLPPGATDIMDLIEYRKMNFAIGNILKACYRLGNCSHSDKLRDLRKIIWFSQRELDRILKEGG